MKIAKKLLAFLCSVILLAGCASGTASGDNIYIDPVPVEEIMLEDEAVALAASPAATGTALMPVASGTAVDKNDRATIDRSNVSDGYVMVYFSGTTQTKLKVQVAGPNTTYNYDLPVQTWATFPLSDGNGDYKVNVLENTTGNKYAFVLSGSFKATLNDEFAPFIRPNQYVNYESNATNTVKKAAELAGSQTDPLKKVELIYDFVVKNLTYDTDKASNVRPGYLPVLDTVLSNKKGICFDYAALMAGMLRSQGVPCKLVVGYAGTAYHAWISVWTKETGWIDGVIYFDGSTWHRMDPTFASSGGGSDEIMKYIGDGSNYTSKYIY